MTRRLVYHLSLWEGRASPVKLYSSHFQTLYALRQVSCSLLTGSLGHEVHAAARGFLKLTAPRQQITCSLGLTTIVLHTFRREGWRIKLGSCFSGFIHLRVVAVPLRCVKASGWLVGSELTCARCHHHSTRHMEGYWSSFKSAAPGLQLAATRVLTQARAKVFRPTKKSKVASIRRVALRLSRLFTALVGRLPVIVLMSWFGICSRMTAVCSRRLPEIKLHVWFLCDLALLQWWKLMHSARMCDVFDGSWQTSCFWSIVFLFLRCHFSISNDIYSCIPKNYQGGTKTIFDVCLLKCDRMAWAGADGFSGKIALEINVTWQMEIPWFNVNWKWIKNTHVI